MNGNAPKSPSTGSQVVVLKKANPNLCLGMAESRHSSRTNRTDMRTTVAAKTKVIRRAISSPSRRRDRKEREPETGPAPGSDAEAVATLLNFGQSLLLLSDDFLRQPRVRKSFSVILPVTEHPRHETLYGVALGRIGELLGDQQPGKSGNGIRLFSFGIGDGNAEVVRHILSCTGCSRSNAGERGLHKNTIGILYVTVGNLVSFCVDQLDIPNGVWRILDRAGDTFVSLAAKPNGPVRGGSFTDLGFPFLADFGTIVGEAVTGAAPIGAVDDSNVLRRQLASFVGVCDERIIPLGHLAKVNPRQRLSTEIQRSVYSRNVVSGNDRPQNRGEMKDRRAMFVLVSL